MRSFLDSKIRKQIGFCRERTSADEEGQHRTINARRKKEEDRRKEEARKKAEVEARKKTEEGQSSKDVQTWRK
jgi:hypothetical protein